MRKLGSLVATMTTLAGLGSVATVPAVAQIGPGNLIAFAAWDPDDLLDRDVFVVDPATPNAPVNLTGDHPDAPPDENPSWSPDGSQIAFDSFRSTNQPTIHVMNADGSDITRISSTPCCDRDFQPAWSPDGERIAFVSTRDGDGEYEIFVMNDEGEFAETYTAGTSVTLTATANKGSLFAGWSGDCSGTSTTCTLTMDADRSVTASFSTGSGGGGKRQTLTIFVEGSSGRVDSVPTGIACPSDCAENYATGTVVTLTATAGKRATFVGWSGACSGTARTCSVTMTAPRSATATFVSA